MSRKSTLKHSLFALIVHWVSAGRSKVTFFASIPSLWYASTKVDPANTAPIGTELAKQGPLGIFCLCLIAAIVILWRTIVADRTAAAAALKAEREASATVLKEANATILALQESRLQDAKKTTEVLTNTAGVMQNQTAAIRDLEDSLRGMLAEAQARRGQR